MTSSRSTARRCRSSRRWPSSSAGAGTQFDPDVAAALVALVRGGSSMVDDVAVASAAAA